MSDLMRSIWVFSWVYSVRFHSFECWHELVFGNLAQNLDPGFVLLMIVTDLL